MRARKKVQAATELQMRARAVSPAQAQVLVLVLLWPRAQAEAQERVQTLQAAVCQQVLSRCRSQGKILHHQGSVFHN